MACGPAGPYCAAAASAGYTAAEGGGITDILLAATQAYNGFADVPIDGDITMALQFANAAERDLQRDKSRDKSVAEASTGGFTVKFGGRKFINGAATGAFNAMFRGAQAAEASTGAINGAQSRGLELIKNADNRAVIARALAVARADVSLSEMAGQNISSGVVIEGKSGTLSIGQHGQTILDGKQLGSAAKSNIIGPLVETPVPIQNAEAIAVSLPNFARRGMITQRARVFDSLSRKVGNAPVFVRSPRDGALFLFEHGFEPVEFPSGTLR